MNECATQSYDPTERVGGFYTSTDTTDTRARHTSPLVKHIISTSSRRSSRAASVDDAASSDARRALETALRRALFSAHGVVGGGSVVTEVLEATTTKASVEPPNAVMSLISEEDTEEEEEKQNTILHLVGVVKAPRDAERTIASALALCRHPERARVVARADDLVALGMDARVLMRRAVRGERGERER